MQIEYRPPYVYRLAMEPTPSAAVARSPEMVTARLRHMRQVVTLQYISVVPSCIAVCLYGEWCVMFTLRVVCYMHIHDLVMVTYTHLIKSIRRRAALNRQAAMLGITVPQLLADVAAGRRFLVVVPMMPCLLYTSPSPRDRQKSRMPSSA